MSQYWKFKDYRGSMKRILPMFGADYAEIIVEGALVNTKNGLSELQEVLTYQFLSPPQGGSIQFFRVNTSQV